MAINVDIPELGESVTEAILVEWLKQDGEYVEVDEPVCLIETDKADAELPAPAAGLLKTLNSDGDMIRVGQTVAEIDPEGNPGVERGGSGEQVKEPAEVAAEGAEDQVGEDGLSPAVRRLVTENDLDPSAILGSAPWLTSAADLRVRSNLLWRPMSLSCAQPLFLRVVWVARLLVRTAPLSAPRSLPSLWPVMASPSFLRSPTTRISLRNQPDASGARRPHATAWILC